MWSWDWGACCRTLTEERNCVVNRATLFMNTPDSVSQVYESCAKGSTQYVEETEVQSSRFRHQQRMEEREATWEHAVDDKRDNKEVANCVFNPPSSTGRECAFLQYSLSFCFNILSQISYPTKVWTHPGSLGSHWVSNRFGGKSGDQGYFWNSFYPWTLVFLRLWAWWSVCFY